MVSKRLRDVRQMASLLGSRLFEQEVTLDWEKPGQEFHKKVAKRLNDAGFRMVQGSKFTSERWRGPAPKDYERGVGRYAYDRRIERLKLLDIVIDKTDIGNDVIAFWRVSIGPLSGMEAREDSAEMKRISIDIPDSASDNNKVLFSAYSLDLNNAYKFLDKEITSIENQNKKIEASNKKFAKGKKLVFPFSLGEENRNLRKGIIPCGCK